MARRFITARGLANPNAQLQVGGSVNLVGLGPLFSGQYDLTAVRHLYDGRSGLRTEFEGERAGLGRN